MSARRLALLFGAASGLLWAQVEININSRYTVESVDIAGGSKTQISRGLREDLEHMVGQRLNQASLERVARRMRNELHARFVSPKVSRGTQPEQVMVLFEVKGKRPSQHFDLSLPKGIYHSRQGWSGVLDAKATVGDSRLSVGIASDGDAMIERFAGVRAGYENLHVGTDRLRLGFQFASYHTQWSRNTLAELEATPDAPGIYRTRQDFAPSVTVVLAEPLTLAAGASFQRFQAQFPAAHTEAANAVTTTLRYARRLEDPRGDKHEIDAGYNLRAATKSLDSDYVYARHVVDAEYTYRWNKQSASVKFEAGRMSGKAPLFERFVLGNTTTLRGWDKHELGPLGGNRVAHGSLEYTYHGFQVFYDTGSLWSDGQSGEVKHSLGLGFENKDGFFLALAFPIKSGRAQPIFMSGIAF
jgi:hypothetical protein